MEDKRRKSVLGPDDKLPVLAAPEEVTDLSTVPLYSDEL